MRLNLYPRLLYAQLAFFLLNLTFLRSAQGASGFVFVFGFVFC